MNLINIIYLKTFLNMIRQISILEMSTFSIQTTIHNQVQKKMILVLSTNLLIANQSLIALMPAPS